jgi:transcriptional regulator with XRE-family HTH domain
MSLTDPNAINDLTRSDLAGHLGVSKSYISQLFAGDTRLNLRTLAKIERVLGGRLHVSMMKPGQRCDSDIENPENVRCGHRSCTTA